MNAEIGSYFNHLNRYEFIKINKFIKNPILYQDIRINPNFSEEDWNKFCQLFKWSDIVESLHLGWNIINETIKYL